MTSNLYELLGVDKSASPEDIRKAYKKKALATHPDRLGPRVSATEKEQANEQFRLVNNAYEVLSNTENRKLYDQYGVWPPPTPQPEYQSAGPSFGRDPFANDPFFSRMGRGRRAFVFTDPFELFNSLFGDLHRAFADDPFFADAFPSASHSPFGRSPFDRSPLGRTLGASPFDSLFGSPLGGGLLGQSMFSGPLIDSGDYGTNRSAYSPGNQAFGSNGRWVSQSQITRTINGRTETIIKKRDTEGNEHVQHLSPEGERYTINGVEQPPPGKLVTGHPSDPPAVTSLQPLSATSSYSGSNYDRTNYYNSVNNYSNANKYDTAYAPLQQPPPATSLKSRPSHNTARPSGELARTSHDYGTREDRMQRSHSSGRSRHEYAEPIQAHESGHHHRISSRRHLHEPPEGQQHTPQPQVHVQQAYAHSQTYSQAYDQPEAAYSSQPIYSQPQPLYNGHGSGTRANPIYVDDRSPPPVSHHAKPRRENSYHTGDKRRRDAVSPSDAPHDDHKTKWWHGSGAWLSGLLKHFKIRHHESRMSNNSR